MIYLDNPATSMQKPEIVYEMMWKNTVNNSVNAGRGGHWASIRGAEGIAAAQEEIADLFKNSIYAECNVWTEYGDMRAFG